MTWEDDPLFKGQGAGPWTLGDVVAPCFRVCAYFPYREAHPYTNTEAFEELFACFAPILRDHCDRIRMWDRPGAKARRSTRISTEDWTPIRHMKSSYSDVEHGIWTGFYFIDRRENKGMTGGKPCSFRYFVYGNATTLDACIPLEDWRAGRLDIAAVRAALQKIPYYSLLAGYGLSLGETYYANELPPIARKYPALDLAAATSRNYFPADWPDEQRDDYWIAGINWLTAVGEPFLNWLGGAKAVADGLPSAITVDEGPHGAIFQLGARPITGEAGADDEHLPLYRALGRRLRPSDFHVKDHDLESVGLSEPYRSFGPVFGETAWEESIRWARRFYDDQRAATSRAAEACL